MDKPLGELYCFKGKLFDNLDDFWKFIKQWPDAPFNFDDFKTSVQNHINDIVVANIQRNGQLTNREAYQMLRMCTDWSVGNGE